MTPAALKAEIDTGPLAATLSPLVATGNHGAIAASLNDPNGASKGLVTLTEMDKQALLRAFMPVAIALAGRTAAIQAKWDRLLDMLRYMESTPVTDINALLALAVTDTLLTQPQADSLKTRKGSRAEVLWGRLVSHVDVSQALKG